MRIYMPMYVLCNMPCCGGGGGGVNGGLTLPLSTPSPAPLGLGDRHLPGLLVLAWGGGVD
jgi:hypothetical protein